MGKGNTATVTVKVTETDLQGIVKRMIEDVVGPRDLDLMWELIDDWEPGNGKQTFNQYVKAQDWTLGAALSFLSYQCRYWSGGIDTAEWSVMWRAFRPVFERLTNVQTLIREFDGTGGTPTPQGGRSRTVAGGVEVWTPLIP